MSKGFVGFVKSLFSFISEHPKALLTLFSTELWERFGYYGMRAILVLYLVDHVGMERANALQLYALFTSMVYLTPIVGGWLADKYLGRRKAVMIGGAVMAIGYFALSFESLLYFALTAVVIGNGFFKPNIASMVGGIYPEGDSRKDGAYTIFYMGINLGALLSPLVCGTLGEKIAFHWGFIAAGLGMAFGVAWFKARESTLKAVGLPPQRDAKKSSLLNSKDFRDVVVYTAACLAVSWLIVWSGSFLKTCWSLIWDAQWLFAGEVNWLALWSWRVFLFVAAFVVYRVVKFLFFSKRKEEAPQKLSRIEWHRMVVILICTIAVLVFFMGFEQAGGTLTLFAKEKTASHLFGVIKMEASYYQSVNPILIVLLAPFFEMLWRFLGKRMGSATKQGAGLVILGLGFLIMYFAEMRFDAVGPVSPLWLMSFYLVATCGELALSPIGLAFVNKLSPERMRSFMMAVFFVGIAGASYLAGTLEEMLHNLNTNYGWNIDLWLFLVFTPIITGILLLLFSKPIRKLTHGAD